LKQQLMRTVRTHVQENGGAASAIGVGIGTGVAVATAIGACGKASLDRLSHDR
jgi:Fe-S cluster biogenesis protein NfuA